MKAKAIFTAALLLAAGFTARAVDGWSVQASYNTGTKVTTFTISRTQNTAVAETVKYRLVNLSAYAGEHYNVTKVDGMNSSALSGNLTFGVNQTSKTILVQESDAGTDAYKYQTAGTKRSYKLEVTDAGGFFLADETREMTTGTSFSADKVSKSITNLVYFNSSGNYTSDVSSSKYVDVAYTPPTGDVETSGTLSGYVLIDDSYDYTKKPATVSTSTLNSTGADAAYLKNLKYKIYATVCFTEKEKDDGYQYVQIIAGTSSTSYDTGYDPEGSVNDPNNSVYKACFELSTSSDQGQGKAFFPHRYSTATGTNEFSLSDGKLWQQKFKSGYQATDSGSLVFDADEENITTRFDAGGDNNDTWGYKDLFVRMALVDATAPKVSAISVAPGRHSRGNTVYVSVAFDEIVKVSGTPTLTTTNDWGDLSYVAGDGTNVLTFSGTIGNNANGNLHVIRLNGTVKDLAGNSLTGSTVSRYDLCSLDASYAYTISYDLAGGTLPDGYPATYTYDAAVTLTNPTFLGCSFSGWTGSNGNTPSTSVTIAQYSHGSKSYTANWTDHWDITHEADGSSSHPYTITTAAGMEYLKEVVNGGNGCIGLYFQVGCDIDLSSVHDTFHGIGINTRVFSGIFDGQGFTISNLYVDQGSNSCAGLFKVIDNATIKNVIIDGATVQGEDEIGAVVGRLSGSGKVQNCFVINSTINGNEKVSATVGYVESGSASGNHYYNCTIKGTVSSDVFTLTVPSGITASLEPTVSYKSVNYYAAGTAVTLSVPSGYVMLNVEVNGAAATDNGDGTWGFSMPVADATVTATVLPIVSYIDADGNAQSHVCTPIESSDSNQDLGTAEKTNWYVVSGNVSTKNINFKDAITNIILCDGATLSISVTSSPNGIDSNQGSINIFAQSGGTGAINIATACSNGIFVYGDVNINGGSITVNSASVRGIWASNGNLTIRRGYVDAYGNTYGIGSGNNVNILSGIVNASSSSASNRCGVKAYGTITLGCATAADRITASSYGGTVVVASGQTLTDGTAAYTGTLSSEQKAAIAGKTLQSATGAVFYIDADGVQRACFGATQITASGNYGSYSNAEGWYYVSGNVTLNSTLNLRDQNVHLILCDGATLSITPNSSDTALSFNNNASIYGQSGGSGRLNITSQGVAISNSGNRTAFCINGGVLSVVSSASSSIFVHSDFIIRRGTVNVSGNVYGIRGDKISILGGIVSATGNNAGIISAGNLITLGWSDSGDSITASRYDFGNNAKGTIIVATGQAFTDGTVTYTGELSSEQIDAIANKTLRPAANPSDDNLVLTARRSTFGRMHRYFTTFYHPTKNYRLSEGAQAFTLNENTQNGNKEFYRIGDGSIVPKECAVIIFADKPAVSLTATTLSNPPTPVGTNILQGVGFATAVSTLVNGTQKVYVVSGDNNGIGLYEFSGTTIPAYKAYIVE